MAISRFKTSTLAQGLPKYTEIWDQTTVYGVPANGLIAKYETPPSSGSTWTDTVGGYNISLSGTTYNSANGGTLTMGTGSNSSLSFNGTSDYTVAVWINPTAETGTSYSTTDVVWGVSDTSSPGSLLVGLGSDGVYVNGYDCNGVSALGGSGAITTNTWQLLTLTLGAGNGSTSSLGYVNSSQIGSAFNGYGGSKPTPFRIGTEGTTLNSNNFDGKFGSVYVWNRKITAAEVAQLFEYSRGRFGV